MQTKNSEQLKQLNSKTVHNATTPNFRPTRLDYSEENKNETLTKMLFIGLAIFCMTIFYISLKSLIL